LELVTGELVLWVVGEPESPVPGVVFPEQAATTSPNAHSAPMTLMCGSDRREFRP
jgi:hypothetical protein